MRKKIWKMSEGQFNRTVPRIELRPENIIQTITEGEDFRGSFSILCDKENFPKGIVYCDNPYIYVSTPAFNEENSTIFYRVTASNLRMGDEILGSFFIYSDGAVFTLPFKINVAGRYPASSIGEIKGIEDFGELARRSFKEALALFPTPEFSRLMEKAPKDVALFYRGFSRSGINEANLEEFLTACGLKERVTFDVDTSKREYSYVTQNRKETLDITRNTWGYIKIEAESDADFITVESNVITNDFFLGSKLSLNYYIHKDLLHDGKNYATITLKGMGIVKKIRIVASLRDLRENIHTRHVLLKRNVLELYSTYEDFRLKRMDGSTWAKKTVTYCRGILESDEITDRNFFRLIMTHALIVEGDRKEALDMIKSLRTDIEDKKSAHWAYLLYLGALLEPEEEYVNRLRREIENIQDLRPDDIRVFWFLLFLKREYVKNSQEKLKALKLWIMSGFDSPVLFAEVYDLYCENVHLIDNLSEFPLKTLSWAGRRGGLTKPVCDRIFDLLLKEMSFDAKVFDLVKKAYKVTPSKAHLKILVSYLLRNSAKGRDYAPYYEKGIEENFKLTGLFEAYVESLPLNHMEKLSDMVLRYFSYKTTISAERKALIYANVILFKDSDYQLYESYRPLIREFCLAMMKQGILDDNITVCYQDYLDLGRVDSKLADSITKIIYAKKVICMHPKARRLLLYEDQFKDPVSVPFNSHIAFVPVYSKDFKVFIELEGGFLCTDEKVFYLEDTINSSLVYDDIKALCSDKANFFYHDLPHMVREGDIEDVYNKEAENYLFDERINPSYIRSVFPVFRSFFRRHEREDVCLRALLYNNRFRDFDNESLTYLAGLLMASGEDDKAIYLLKDYVLKGVDYKLLLETIKRITSNPKGIRGEFVLELAISLLREGYFSKETIDYLLKHFIGRIEDMRLIFKYAITDEEALGDFCERFIVQGLYAGNLEPGDDGVLIAYLGGRANPMIVEAYISYFCHGYMLRDVVPPESVFVILFRQLKLTDSVNDACRFAYSKYLCRKQDLSPGEEEILDILINDQIKRNLYFPFYQEMSQANILRYHLYDRFYIGIKAAPGEDLAIEVRAGGENAIYDMTECYEGIYVKDLVVFFGENVAYRVYNKNEAENIIEEGEYSYQDVGLLSESRFYRINKLEESLFYKETDSLIDDISDYNSRLKAGKKIFKSL